MAQAIATKFFGATDTRGARIQVKSWRGTKYYSYDYSASCPHQAAFDEWLNEVNQEMKKEYGSECPHDGWFKVVAKGNEPGGCGYVFIIQ